MSEERMRILNLLAEGKIDAGEAARLLDALASSPPGEPPPPARKKSPKYLRVVAEDGPQRVNVRVPLQLIRSGINLDAMLKGEAGEKVGDALRKHGVPLDLRNLGSAEIDALLQSFADLSIDIEDGDQTIRVFCE